MATVVNDAHLISRERIIEYSRLNEAEGRVLRLLAEGHTAKSIATELGMSTAAVNERLREARRKTGIGSSRELARLLKAQENRHEHIGMVSSPISAASVPSGAKARRRRTGVFVMLAFLLAMAAGAPAELSQTPDATDPHAKVRAETPDPSWAEPMEAAIRRRLMRIPLVGGDGNSLRIACGVTLCEVTGTLVGEGRSPNGDDPRLSLNRAVADLQDKSLNEDLARLGLMNESSTFVSGEGKPDHVTFFLYYSRADEESE